MVYLNNPFNYAGSKFKLIDQILPLLPLNINKYVEVFSGGFTLGLNVAAKEYYYNDKCKQLVELIKVIKDTTIEKLIQDIDSIILKYNLPLNTKECTIENEEGYKQLRKEYNEAADNTYEKSILFYTLICYSFNHLICFNNKGEFNVPMGRLRSTFNSSLRNKLNLFSKRIKEIGLVTYCIDFQKLYLMNLTADDYVYIDPPYFASDDSYGRISELKWTAEKEQLLYEYCDDLNVNGIKFGLSNVLKHNGKTNDLLIEWSKKYNVHYMNKNYNNCNYQFQGGNKETIEVFITNYIAETTKEPEAKIIISNEPEKIKNNSIVSISNGRAKADLRRKDLEDGIDVKNLLDSSQAYQMSMDAYSSVRNELNLIMCLIEELSFKGELLCTVELIKYPKTEEILKRLGYNITKDVETKETIIGWF